MHNINIRKKRPFHWLGNDAFSTLLSQIWEGLMRPRSLSVFCSSANIKAFGSSVNFCGNNPVLSKCNISHRLILLIQRYTQIQHSHTHTHTRCSIWYTCISKTTYWRHNTHSSRSQRQKPNPDWAFILCPIYVLLLFNAVWFVIQLFITTAKNSRSLCQ